ncbi:hypothetical protein [Micromonospora sp. NPDC050695]|uniref:hypothetical protein n=1 Tax=Micromonospora sp. NPDC050695 TaxID=3154938 RepID=UPI0033E08A63
MGTVVSAVGPPSAADAPTGATQKMPALPLNATITSWPIRRKTVGTPFSEIADQRFTTISPIEAQCLTRPDSSSSFDE